MNITHVRLLTVPVSDQDAAKTFYADRLGFEVVTDQSMGPVRWLQVAPKGAQTSVVLADHMPGVTPGSVQGLILETSDLDGDCERLREAGVEVDGPQDLPWGRQATLTDPDGNGLVLAER
ncbi:catechol 2,3-dioxygenase-like lactoylglutathione lyase family enzyme [Actinomadura pelletieri DSM 43383]|uniref:Catechol 2,3-dioxygenase-like lactoylglutathione lyase family enzyme n=1 Tax=Actinomadura pelletieri DSM 43383 TaxID=1120940 RepID=A0A495QSV5_9ACTN|nr:VOC family protein [Actinomadura pelletieri]RKS76596.1 catechol 2,3-dioxygenase-like lactoylglutathione lyase family enzyme [Actinomadura pelletieri DSM 43383]